MVSFAIAMSQKKKSEIISRFLTPAIKLWIRTQVESIMDLDILIDAGDRQILSGKINQVNLTAKEANYQGIFINYASVSTENIAVNLGGILRGKPLKLLHPIFVSGNLTITAEELHKSLSSSLLTSGLKDLVKLLLHNENIENTEEIINKYQINWQSIDINNQSIIIVGNLINNLKNIQNKLIITSNISLENQQNLKLTQLKIEGIKELNNDDIHDLTIDLGNDVSLSELTISPEVLHCVGSVKVVSE